VFIDWPRWRAGRIPAPAAVGHVGVGVVADRHPRAVGARDQGVGRRQVREADAGIGLVDLDAPGRQRQEGPSRVVRGWFGADRRSGHRGERPAVVGAVAPVASGGSLARQPHGIWCRSVTKLHSFCPAKRRYARVDVREEWVLNVTGASRKPIPGAEWKARSQAYFALIVHINVTVLLWQRQDPSGNTASDRRGRRGMAGCGPAGLPFRPAPRSVPLLASRDAARVSHGRAGLALSPGEQRGPAPLDGSPCA
jgi:hypothetical protein